MKTYSPSDISKALRTVGVKDGDTLFFCAQLFPVGKMLGISRSSDFLQAYLDAIFDVIGKLGTLVVPTYSQQVARFGLPYHHEQTPTPTGIFNEFVRTHPSAVRSFHPVFSLTALGAHAAAICGKVSGSAFGVRSAYDYLFSFGAVGVSLGFELEEGYLTTGAHYLETRCAVPYYYNKIVGSPVYREGQRSDQVFTMSVRYRDFNIQYDFARYVHEIQRRGLLASARLGNADLFSCKLSDQMQIGFDLLSNDPYAFLRESPKWRKGEIPNEGSTERLSDADAEKMNWVGFQLHNWG